MFRKPQNGHPTHCTNRPYEQEGIQFDKTGRCDLARYLCLKPFVTYFKSSSNSSWRRRNSSALSPLIILA
jgi:hypothetical protein